MLTLSILTVLVTIVAGYMLRHFKIVEADFGEKLLMIGFYLTVPAISLRTLSDIELDTGNILFLGVLAAGTIFSLLAGFVVSVIGKKPNKELKGTILLSALILNSGFVFPFAQSGFGDYGVAMMALSNLVIATSTYSLGYIIASFYGNKSKNDKKLLLKPFTAPSFLAILLALTINYYDFDISVIYPMLDFIGQPTGLLNALAIGALIQINKVQLDIFKPMIARWSVGIILIILIAVFSEMSSTDKAILAAILISPLGFNSVTLAALEGLDTKYAANALSVSFIIGMITVPVAILLFA